MTEPTFDDALTTSVGQVRSGAPFVLGQDEADAFERATWLDKAYGGDAAVAEYPDTLVAGFQLLSMVDAAGRLAEDGAPSSVWGVNYGLDKVRFIAPVHLGQTVHSTYEVLAVEPRGEGYKVLRRVTFTVEGQDTPAMIADWWGLVFARGAGADALRSS